MESMLKRANYFWRLVATAFSFSIFGIGGVLLTLIAFPAISLLVRDPKRKKKKARFLIHRVFRLFLNMMAILGLFQFSLTKAERELAKHQSKIIIANHPSLIDVVAIIAILPNADCIVKENLWNNPFIRGAVSAAGYIKNTENVDKLLEACEDSMREGYSLVIFPEGTRTKISGEISLQRGASNIALRCKRDLVPVTVRCQPTTLTKNEPWYSIPEKRANFSLSVGKAIKTNDFEIENQSMSINARCLTRHIKAYFTEELRSYA